MKFQPAEENKIIIKKNPNGDSRTAPKDVTFDQVHKATKEHIQAVQQVMQSLGDMLEAQGFRHDWTKLEYEQEFYDNLMATLTDGTNFVSNTWYQKHINKEKHHPFDKCHDDINLLDIIETIVDCVCAGKARSGEIRPLEFDEEILNKAVANTVKMIDEMTEVKK